MRGRYMLVIGGLVLVAFGGLAWGAYRDLRSVETKARVADQREVLEGHFDNHNYLISEHLSDNKNVVNFTPNLSNDNNLLVEILKKVISAEYNVDVPTSTVPAVETMNDQNYITFSFGRNKIFFQLFRSDNGEIGSAVFWNQNL